MGSYLPWCAWAHGHDSALRLPALTASPTAPASPRGFVPEPPQMNQSRVCAGPQGTAVPVAEGRVGFSLRVLSMAGALREEEEKEHTQRGFKGHFLVQVGTRICPIREDRAALKFKTKELGFALHVCAYAMGSQVGKSNQMAQVWPPGPMQGMGTRPGSGEGDSCSCSPPATPAQCLHCTSKRNKTSVSRECV